MTSDKSMEIVRSIFQAFNERQWDQLEKKIFSPNLIYIQNGRRGGLAKWLQDSRECTVSFPDGRLSIDSQVIEAGKVVTRTRFEGTHLGPFAGMPPTGKTFNIEIVTTSRTENGVIVEHVEQVDEMGLMEQLGLGMSEGG